MKNQKGFVGMGIIIAIVAVLAIGGIVYYAGKNSNSVVPQNTSGNLVGGDKDAHGCIGSAGYSWCAEKNKCLRTWEEKCEVAPVTNPTTIEFTFPTAGITLTEGKTYNITWKNSGPSITSYGLYLENDQAGYIRIGETSKNSFSWTVPSILSYTSSADNYNGAPAPTDGYRISIGDSNSKETKPKIYYSETFKIIPKNNIAITTLSSLPSAESTINYSTTISATGGSDSYAWSVSSGSLPPGLSLKNAVCFAFPCKVGAIISGIPTSVPYRNTYDPYRFTITLTSGSQSTSKEFTILVDAY